MARCPPRGIGVTAPRCRRQRPRDDGVTAEARRRHGDGTTSQAQWATQGGGRRTYKNGHLEKCATDAMGAVSPRARTRHWCRAWRDGGTPTIDWSRAARDAGAARVLAPCWPRHVAGNNHAVVIPSPRRHDVAGDMGDACVAPMIHRRWVSRDKPIASPMTTFLHKLRDLVSAHISAFLRRSRLLVSRVSTPSGTRAPSPTPGRMSTPTEGSREP